ncbi:hypothetical protein PMIN01_03389 [Paraphaeosphaeria minitans]|uniref:Uncharacterized protein n=1 Tax=Paraphaeosphaeria minitans TaxID=565426 RepID=A0A9P6GMR8_9PLEO|nr:hypothetical protein PMIN01_03389 [Paraphaeosphaeria minitans]
MLTKAALAMLFADEVWAVYGIGVQRDVCVAGPMGEAVKREETPVVSSSRVPSSNPTHSVSPTTTDPVTNTDQPSATETVPFNTPFPTGAHSSPTVPPAISSQSAESPNQLDSGVKIGIAVLAAMFSLALLAFLLESCYLRPRRREKALQRAVQEVENGERVERALTELKGSQEIVVLESRVSIHFDDGDDGYRGEESEGYTMAALIEAIITCLTGSEPRATTYHEKEPLVDPCQPRTAEEAASRVVHALLQADKAGPDLKRTLDEIVGSYGWTEKIAERVLVQLHVALREAEKLQGPVKEAYDKACSAALAVEGFVKEHPVFFTVIALGVIITIAPWVLEALGFAELGPLEGSFAAAWQARYAGFVPKGSLFSFFQRLGMVWH